ncbi:Lipase [Parasponia andersonii]|uniref:Lipase n=1 Tax=Parasponia andersonii TaxID=3476 RepID=A0A2P5DXH8_PARAD|nr:Lipase [Parasponia andersonii]
MAPSTFFLIIFVHSLAIFSYSCSASKPKLSPEFPAILVFGDSTVDTGNNNYIHTAFKANHYPYGKDFKGHVPTGRFSNGKLVPDLVAFMLNIKDTVTPFLHPKLSDKDVLTGVSFASAGSGYDELTTTASGVIPISKQIHYFKKYMARPGRIVGEKQAKERVSRALVIVSAGTNDFLFNYYDIPARRFEFNTSGYQDFVQKRLKNFIEELYNHGCRRITVSGLPPVGCLPIQRSIQFWSDRRCIEDQNLGAKMYNHKLAMALPKIQANLPGSKVVYADIYTPLFDMINHPKKYGFVETEKGCCGTGLVEAGPTCNVLTPTCHEASKYLFWDSIHPSEATYKYLAQYLEKEVLPKLNGNHSHHHNYFA